MNEENITSETQPGGKTVAGESTDVKETVSDKTALESLTLNEINDFLGKQYKDKGTALKSIKDTFSYVGKKIEASAPVQSDNSEVAKQLREMKTELFYSKHPEYESYKGVISKMGENPASVVEMPEFKDIFGKATGFDKIQKTKTVLESNPRIGQIRNKQKEANEALNNREYVRANSIAVESVIEGLDLGK
jgi:hypothetical protein